MVLSYSVITEAAAGSCVGSMPTMRTGKHKFSPRGVRLSTIIANCSGGGNASHHITISGCVVLTCSTIISGCIGQPATPSRYIPNQTQPAPFWRAFSCAFTPCSAKARVRPAAFGEVCRSLPCPQSARLLPRLACALNMRLFVHFVRTIQAPPALALRGKNDVSKIVQICALFCML